MQHLQIHKIKKTTKQFKIFVKKKKKLIYLFDHLTSIIR